MQNNQYKGQLFKQIQLYKPLHQPSKAHFQRTKHQKLASNSRSRSGSISKSNSFVDPFKYIKDIKKIDGNNEEDAVQSHDKGSLQILRSVQSAQSIKQRDHPFTKINHNVLSVLDHISDSQKPHEKDLVKTKGDSNNRLKKLLERSNKQNNLNSSNLPLRNNHFPINRTQVFISEKAIPNNQLQTLRQSIKNKDLTIRNLESKLDMAYLNIFTSGQNLQKITIEKSQLIRQIDYAEETIEKQETQRQTLETELNRIRKKYQNVLELAKNDHMRTYLEQQLKEKQNILFSAGDQISSLKLKISCMQFKFEIEKKGIIAKKDAQISTLLDNYQKVQKELGIFRNKKNKPELLDFSLSYDQQA